MRVLLSFILIGSLLIKPSVTLAETFLFDDFTGTIVNSDRWHIPTWTGPGDGTFVGRTQFRCIPAPLPKAENSNAKILLETYNPTANIPGDSFYGTDMISNQLFSSGNGIRIKVRAKMNTSRRGIVDGNLVRTQTENVPTEPMYFHLNIWAPDQEWALAYDQDFQPVSDPKLNQEYWMSVDSVNIQSFTPAPGKSNLAPVLLPLLLNETQYK